MRRLGSLAIGLAIAGCGGSGASTSTNPDPGGGTLTASQAATIFNQALTLAAPAAPQDAHQATLSGNTTVGEATVAFAMTLDKEPFAPHGTATITAGSHVAAVSFDGSAAGSLTLDGVAAGTLAARIPMTGDFPEAEASWAMHQAMLPGFASSGITVTQNADGSITIDGSETCGNVTVTFTQLTIDPANGTINGTITIDDGNGNTAVLDFAGTTLTVTVNGQVVATIDLSQFP